MHMEPQQLTFLGRPSLVARTSRFRWRWVATRLHTFVIASDFVDVTPNRVDLDAFLDAGVQYALEHKGGLPRGLQTGTATITVALTRQLHAATMEWAQTVHGRRFAAFPFPVLVDLSTRKVTRPERMIVGGIYSSYLQTMVDTHIRAPIASQ